MLFAVTIIGCIGFVLIGVKYIYEGTAGAIRVIREKREETEEV